jgi:peptidoglycan/xylan/chitin deacetylase (PgdA/CDA1 family)
VAASLDVLLELLGRRPRPAWGGAGWGLCVTHDVDTAIGLRRALQLADVVERAGMRSCFYVVGDAAGREPGIVRELRDRGHEIGSHDVVHDNRLCFLPPAQMEERLQRARAAVQPYGGTGFRAPSLMRTPRLLAAIARHFTYDSSVCDTDLEFARGCTTVFPYQSGGLLEIPITLPMDSSLRYVGCGPADILRVWKEKCDYLRRLGGLGVLVTHAEPHLSGGDRMRTVLSEFLGWIAEHARGRVVLPQTVAHMLDPRPNS